MLIRESIGDMTLHIGHAHVSVVSGVYLLDSIGSGMAKEMKLPSWAGSAIRHGSVLEKQPSPISRVTRVSTEPLCGLVLTSLSRGEY